MYDVHQPFLVEFHSSVFFDAASASDCAVVRSCVTCGKMIGPVCSSIKVRNYFLSVCVHGLLNSFYLGQRYNPLERSTFPEHPDGTLVARVIKIIQLPSLLPRIEEWVTKYLPRPKEGELVYKGTDMLKPLSIDLEDELALGVLLE